MKKILLLYLNPVDWASIAAPPYGLEILASSLKGLPVDVKIYNPFIYEDPIEKATEMLVDYSPDLIGISIRNMDNMAHVWNSEAEELGIESRCFIEDIEAVIRTISDNTQANIIVGGVGFSIAPVEILKRYNLRFGVKGPGEETFRSIVESLLRNEDLGSFIKENYKDLSGVIYLETNRVIEEEIKDFKDIGLKNIERVKEYDSSWTGTVPVRVSYGCNGGCYYCVERNHGHKACWRNIDNIIDEIKSVQNKSIWLVASELNFPNEENIMELCNKIEENNIKKTFSSYFLPINFSEKLYKKLRSVGFVDNSICFGLTHVSDKILEKNNVPFRRKHIDELIDTLYSLGAKGVTIGFILGLLGEDKETLLELEEWVIKTSKLFGSGFRCFVNSGVRIYPNTPMDAYAHEEYKDKLYGQRGKYDLLKPLVYSDYKSPKDMIDHFIENTREAEGIVTAYNMGNSIMKDKPDVFIYLQKAHIFRMLGDYQEAVKAIDLAYSHCKLEENKRILNREALRLKSCM